MSGSDNTAAVSTPRAPSRARTIVLAGLLAALLAASAYLSIPLGTVPLTLQVLIVVLIALVLPAETALLAVGTYLLLGAAGAPVFSGGTGGVGVVFGPTGGYLLGFAAGAMLGAGVRSLLMRLGVRRIVADVVCAIVVIAVIYAVGWLQLAGVTGMGLGKAFAAGVAPFLLVDVAKAAVAVALAMSLRRSGVVG